MRAANFPPSSTVPLFMVEGKGHNRQLWFEWNALIWIGHYYSMYISFSLRFRYHCMCFVDGYSIELISTEKCTHWCTWKESERIEGWMPRFRSCSAASRSDPAKTTTEVVPSPASASWAWLNSTNILAQGLTTFIWKHIQNFASITLCLGLFCFSLCKIQLSL